MSEQGGDVTRALKEAAAWFTRLSRRSVTTQALKEFRAWRQAPGNRSAFEKVERAWTAAGALAEDPEIIAAGRAAGGSARRRLGSMRFPAAGWAALALASLVVLAIGILAGTEALDARYATGAAEQRIVRLEDGTVVRLSARSRIAVRIARRERRVELKSGEALFEVAHDAQRPFYVVADGARVTARGTRFDVDRLSDAVQVTLFEGGVEVAGRETPKALRLHPNEMVRVEGGTVQAAAPATPAEVLGWTEGRLVFKDTPLEDALLEVNRFARGPVRLAATDLAHAHVSGVFVAGDTRAFADAAAALFDLAAEPEGGGGYVLKRRTRERS